MFPLPLNYAAKPPELAVAKRKTFLRPIGYKVFVTVQVVVKSTRKKTLKNLRGRPGSLLKNLAV
jgi:hypothetical protein